METRANYLLIGAFTLAGFLGLLAFVLWFARVELDRQFAYYDIVFDSVAGLSSASEVRFAGLPVGQVVDVGLDPDRSGLVRVRIEIEAGTPVRTSTIATVESLGVTGVTFVSLTSGDPGDPLLAEAADEATPDIPSQRSSLQALTENAPQILEEILQVTRQVSDLLGPESQRRVGAILANAESASARLDAALADVTEITDTVAVATADLDDTVATLNVTLARLDSAVAAAGEDVPAIGRDLRAAAAQADAMLAELRATTADLAPALRGFARDGLPGYTRLAGEARDLVANLDRLVRNIERDPGRYLFGEEEPAFRR